MPRIPGIMQRICIVAAITIFLSAPDTMVTGAAAQTATPGRPLQILKILERPVNSKNKRLLAKSFSKTKLAATGSYKQHHRMLAVKRSRTIAPARADTLPAADPVPSADIAVAELPQLAAPLADPLPNKITIGGETVKIASPDDVNEIDLAANDDPATATDTAPISAEAAAPALRDVPAAKAKSDSLKAAAMEPQTAAFGGASWILQVLAALGGAITAGSVAWLLIGATPQRTYG